MMVDSMTGDVKWQVQAHSVSTDSSPTLTTKPPLPGENSTRSWTRIAVSPSFVATVGLSDAFWKLWDAASGELRLVSAAHDGTAGCSCEVDDMGQRVLQEGCPVVAHTRGLTALALSPGGERLASGGWDPDLILWNAHTGAAERSLQGDFTAGEAWSLSFSKDGERLACGTSRGSIRVWDSTTGAMLLTLSAAHNHFVAYLNFSPTENRMLASGGGDGEVRVWDVVSGEKLRSIAGRGIAAFSPDGATILTATSAAANDVQLVDAESGELRVNLSGHTAHVFSASFSVDGSKLASGSRDGTCKV
ncbi:quinon protein alcohol dehydrogenase-like superfamily, partial [Baffinella frigidus]